MVDRLVILSIEGGVARLALNRPDKLNSLNRAMHAQLREAFDQIEQDPTIRAVLLTGAGRGFCAGQDLADLSFDSGAETDLDRIIGDDLNPLIRRIQALPKPVIARVQGIAAGAGANLALACDLVVAARSAYFVQASISIGLAPDCGGTWFLPHRLGIARAMQLAMLGEKLPAERAEQWGLISHCVDDRHLDEEVAMLASRMAKMPTRALGAIKQAIRAAVTSSLDEQLERERDIQTALSKSFDYAEGVSAFQAKRVPRFEGR
jgi:2-(1,2-epoxy-1,2-dihydrophenyl)acetyl-CoA isomerase